MMRPPRGSCDLHDADGLLRAEKRAGEVDGDDRVPLLEGEVLDGHGGSARAGVVEEEVKTPEFAQRRVEERVDGSGERDVGGNGEHSAEGCGSQGKGAVEFRGAASGDDDGVTRGVKREGDGAADTAAAAGDECDFRGGGRVHPTILTSYRRRRGGLDAERLRYDARK